MDPNIAAMSPLGTVISGLTPLLTVGGVAAVVTFGFAGVATTANVVAGTRRRSLWRQIGAELGLRQETETGGAMVAAAPVLRGIRHGRAVEATLLPNGQAQIAVRVANPRHLLDQIPTSDLTALAGAGWLTAAQCQAVNGLKDRRRKGSIAVRGSFVTLTHRLGAGSCRRVSRCGRCFSLSRRLPRAWMRRVARCQRDRWDRHRDEGRIGSGRGR